MPRSSRAAAEPDADAPTAAFYALSNVIYQYILSERHVSSRRRHDCASVTLQEYFDWWNRVGCTNPEFEDLLPGSYETCKDVALVDFLALDGIVCELEKGNHVLSSHAFSSVLLLCSRLDPSATREFFNRTIEKQSFKKYASKTEHSPLVKHGPFPRSFFPPYPDTSAVEMRLDWSRSWERSRTNPSSQTENPKGNVVRRRKLLKSPPNSTSRESGHSRSRAHINPDLDSRRDTTSQLPGSFNPIPLSTPRPLPQTPNKAPPLASRQISQSHLTLFDHRSATSSSTAAPPQTWQQVAYPLITLIVTSTVAMLVKEHAFRTEARTLVSKVDAMERMSDIKLRGETHLMRMQILARQWDMAGSALEACSAVFRWLQGTPSDVDK